MDLRRRRDRHLPRVLRTVADTVLGERLAQHPLQDCPLNGLGYKFGEGIEDTIGGLFKTPTLDEMGLDSLDAFDLGNSLDGIYGNTGDTAANTAATADTLDYMDEDLAWMKDIAEREAINRYTTAEIKVEQHNENHISKDTDLDGVMEAFCFDFAEKLDVSAEGVHE